MKNSLKIALAVTTLAGGFSLVNAETGGTQSAQEALERLMGIAKVMREHGATWTAGLINGHQAGGTSSSRQGDTAESAENQQALMGDDSEAGIICVTNADDGKDWKYSVHQLRPMLVGKSAISGEHIWRDGVGIAIVPKALEEMRAQNTHKVSLRYTDKTPGVNEGREGRPEEINKKLLVVNKSWLLSDNRHHNQHGPNVPGDVLCATVYFQAGATDEGDFARLTAPDMPDRHAAGATTPTHHKKKKAAAKTAEAAKPADAKTADAKKADDKTADAKKADDKTAADAKKEDPKKEEPKKEEAKK